MAHPKFAWWVPPPGGSAEDVGQAEASLAQPPRATASAVPEVGTAPSAETKECQLCRRWVSVDLHAVMPQGMLPMCGLCLAMGELQDAIRRSSLTPEREEAVHQAVWRAHVMVVSAGRGTQSRPYAPLDRRASSE